MNNQTIPILTKDQQVTLRDICLRYKSSIEILIKTSDDALKKADEWLEEAVAQAEQNAKNNPSELLIELKAKLDACEKEYDLKVQPFREAFEKLDKPARAEMEAAQEAAEKKLEDSFTRLMKERDSIINKARREKKKAIDHAQSVYSQGNDDAKAATFKCQSHLMKALVEQIQMMMLPLTVNLLSSGLGRYPGISKWL